MIEIYIVRHGVAVGRDSPIVDAFRPLTSKARKRFRKTAKAFGKLGRKLDLILTSPLVRAVQTAEILAGAAKHGEVAVLEELDPKTAVETLIESIDARANGANSVALVGHEPQLSHLVSALAGVDPEELRLRSDCIVPPRNLWRPTRPVSYRLSSERQGDGGPDSRHGERPPRAQSARRVVAPGTARDGGPKRRLRQHSRPTRYGPSVVGSSYVLKG